MITNKINKNVLFTIECISIVLGGISTFVITIFTIKLAKEKQQHHLTKLISFIPTLALVFSVFINNFFGNTRASTTIIFYVAFAIATFILILIQHHLFKIDGEINAVSHSKTKKIKSKPKTKILVGYSCLLVISLIIIVVSLCIGKSLEIEDTNGPENFALETISDDKLRNLEVSYTAIRAEHGQDGERHNASRCWEHDFDEVYYKAESASGVKVLQATKSLSDTLNLSIKNSVESGNCKIVVVVDDEIYKEIELNSETNLTIENVLNKEIFVVFGSESANVEIEILREFENADKTEIR